MSSGAELKGFDDVLRNLEMRLGDEKVKRATSRALKATANETLEEFKGALEVFKDTGETIESATSGRVTGLPVGVPVIKIGFGAGSRWRLVHLNEFGYAKNSHPRGFGVIRRFSEENAQKYKYRIASHLKIEGFR